VPQHQQLASLQADGRPSRTSQPQSRTKMRSSRRMDTDDHDALRLMLVIAAAHRARRLLAPHREFCDAVTGDPEMAVPYAECEEMCYFFTHLSHDQFGEFPDTGSGISRESGSNLIAWICGST